MGEHDTGRPDPGHHGIDPDHEAFPAGDAPSTGEPLAGQPATGQTAAGQPSHQRRLPKPEPATAAGASGAHGYEIEGPSASNRRRGHAPTPAAPAVEHDGWRAGDTIDIDETPRRRFSFQVPPYMRVAAVIAVATSFGALAGTFAATKVSSDPTPAVVRVTQPDDGALKATVAELQRDVTGLRTSLENSTKALQTQSAKLADRMERSERAQAEPAQKLAKLSEAIERLERRTAQAAANSQSASGQPTTLQAQAAAQAAAQAGAQPSTVQASSAQAAAPMPTAPVAVASADVTGGLGDPRAAGPQVISGWVVRDVRRGIALVEGRYGYIEVETGDTLPGVGRVESIRKQDGRWMVVTSRGVIVAR